MEFEHDLDLRGHRVFAGRLDRAALSIGERLIIKGVKAPYGDFRDWPAIDAWADGVAVEVLQMVQPGDERTTAHMQRTPVAAT